MMGVKVEAFSSQFGNFAELMTGIPTPRSFDELEEIQQNNPVLSEIDTVFHVNSMRFGRVYGFAQEQNGAIVQNLFPIQQNADKQISSSSKTILEMHTETAFHPWRAETLLLLCMRGREDAGTTISLLEDIVDTLDGETIEILHQPVFETTIDESFLSADQPDTSLTTPVLFDGATRITYDRALMRGKSVEASLALQRVSEAVERVKKTFFLRTGQVMVINNRTAIHGRTAFAARYDGTDRWLKRTMVSTRIPGSEELEIRDGRYNVVTTTF